MAEELPVDPVTEDPRVSKSVAFNILARDAWKAFSPRLPTEMRYPVEFVFTAYSRTDQCRDKSCRDSILQLQKRQMEMKRFSDIAYNFMLNDDGLIYEGRGFYATPALPIKFKNVARSSLYIVYLGDFDENPPKDELFELREEFMRYCINQKILLPNYKEFVI